MTSAPVAALRQVWLHRQHGPRRRWRPVPRTPEPLLRGVTLAVSAGEAVALLADEPAAAAAVVSLLAGLARPVAGSVQLAGRDVGAVAPERRGVAVVHRRLGLFERMTVAENAGFCGATPRAVAAMLRLAGLEAQAAALPAALGNPERVRLAIARALLQRSPLLLLDDTLTGLDAASVEAACALVAAARAEREFAVVHASADAGAAFSDVGAARMMVLAGGVVVQDGTPVVAYDAPATASVAMLTGAANLLPGTVLDATEGELLVGLAPGVSVAAMEHEATLGVGVGCLVCVRPERIALAAPALALAEGALLATVRQVSFGRDRWRIRVRLDLTGHDRDLLVDRPAGVPLGGVRVGAAVAVAWQAHHATAFRHDESGAAVAPSLAGSYPDPAPPTPDATPFNLQDRP